MSLVKRYGVPLTALIITLVAFWMLILVWLPYSFLLEQSFRLYLPVSEMGGPKDVYTIANYMSLFDTSVTKSTIIGSIPLQLYIFLSTILYSALVTIVCFVLAYPLAYYVAKVAKIRSLPVLFLLLMLPLLVSEILRSYAWFIILSYGGVLNSALAFFGIGKVRWLTGYNGVMIGLVYTYVLFMLFPIYNSITSLDTNQIEAAYDLGGRWWQVHLQVILPHAKPGIASGATFCFMFAVGSILVPTLLGTPASRWFTEVILRSMFESSDWNTASAYAFLLMLVCLLFISLMMRLFRVQLSDISK